MPKPNGFARLLPTTDRRSHCHEDLLRQILSVGILHPARNGDAMDHRPIKIDECSPRLPIGRGFDLKNQAVTGIGELCQGELMRQEKLSSKRLNTTFLRF